VQISIIKVICDNLVFVGGDGGSPQGSQKTDKEDVGKPPREREACNGLVGVLGLLLAGPS
jgi:hypothetical protein